MCCVQEIHPLLMKISTANTPSVLAFSTIKAHPFLSTSLKSGLGERSCHHRARVKHALDTPLTSASLRPCPSSSPFPPPGDGCRMVLSFQCKQGPKFSCPTYNSTNPHRKLGLIHRNTHRLICSQSSTSLVVLKDLLTLRIRTALLYLTNPSRLTPRSWQQAPAPADLDNLQEISMTPWIGSYQNTKGFIFFLIPYSSLNMSKK